MSIKWTLTGGHQEIGRVSQYIYRIYTFLFRLKMSNFFSIFSLGTCVKIKFPKSQREGRRAWLAAPLSGILFSG